MPTSFVDPADVSDAHAHNMAVWSRLWAGISAEPTPDRARDHWRRLCKNAVNDFSWHHRGVSAHAKVFEVPPPLEFWAGLSD